MICSISAPWHFNVYNTGFICPPLQAQLLCAPRIPQLSNSPGYVFRLLGHVTSLCMIRLKGLGLVCCVRMKLKSFHGHRYKHLGPLFRDLDTSATMWGQFEGLHPDSLRESPKMQIGSPTRIAQLGKPVQ